MITIQDVSFTYKDEKTPALKETSLTVPDGGFLGVIGPAGAGKTTLARAISGMIPHLYPGDFYGSVTVNGYLQAGGNGVPGCGQPDHLPDRGG